MHCVQYIENIFCVPHILQILLDCSHSRNSALFVERRSKFTYSAHSAFSAARYPPSRFGLYAEQAQILSLFSVQGSSNSRFLLSFCHNCKPASDVPQCSCKFVKFLQNVYYTDAWPSIFLDLCQDKYRHSSIHCRTSLSCLHMSCMFCRDFSESSSMFLPVSAAFHHASWVNVHCNVCQLIQFYGYIPSWRLIHI